MAGFTSSFAGAGRAESGSAGAGRDTQPVYGGNLVVALDLGDAIAIAVMAVETAMSLGLVDETELAALEAAGCQAENAGVDGAANGAPSDEESYIDWLAEKLGYADPDVRLDAVTSHFRHG